MFTPRDLQVHNVLVVGCLILSSPSPAQEMQRLAPTKMSLLVASDPATDQCRRVDGASTLFATVPMHRTFHDDFDEHPL